MGVGANTAVFSVANAFFLHPVSLPGLDRLVMLLEQRPGQGPDDWNSASPANIFDWKRQSTSFERLAAYTFTHFNLSGDREPQTLRGVFATADFFETLTVKPLLGRTFVAEEGQPGRDQVVVLSYALWQREFGSDAHVIGRSIRLNGKSCTVLGVMRSEFGFPITAQLWMPLAMDPNEANTRGKHSLTVVARLKPGVSVPQARAEMTTIAGRLEKAFPATNKGWGVMVQPVGQFVSGYYIRHYTLLLLGAVLFVLLIACVNIANLQFARGSGRVREIAVRTALGASRVRLIAQLLTESVLLSLFGALLGLLLGAWGIDLIRSNMPPDIARLIAGWEHVNLDGTVLAWTLVISVAAGLLSGLAPALYSTRTSLSEALKESGRGASSGRGSQRVRNVLVVGEVALALILLVGAGLMVKGTRALLGLNSKYHPESVLTLSFTLPESKYPRNFHRVAFIDTVLQRVASMPSIQGAALVNGLPADYGNLEYFEMEGQPPEEGRDYRLATPLSVSPNYLRLLGVALIEGREISEADGPDSMPAALVNEAMAHRYWPGRSPIGRRVRYGRGNSKRPWLTIVGIVSDVQYDWGERDIKPAIYQSYRQDAQRFSYIVVRTPRDPLAMAGAVRREVAAVDAELPLYEVDTLQRVIEKSVIGISYVAVMLAITGAIALVLACVGISGIMAYAVAERTHEIGIRMALGAGQSDVVGMIARRGLALTLSGLAIGLAGSIALARLLSDLIVGVSETDVTTFSGVSVLLLSTALAACYGPVRRAARLDPMEALRQD